MDYRQIRRGWCLGSGEFRQELLTAAAKRVGPNHYGAERQETGEQKAQGVAKEEIDRLGWAEEDLQTRPKAVGPMSPICFAGARLTLCQ
jgi:hypothetical protein